MANIIRSVAEAIGIIEKEVMRMGSEQTEKEPKTSEHPSVEPSGYCVECSERVSHPKAYFCRVCSESFYNNEREDD